MIAELEMATEWIYDERAFHEWSATHTLDNPDAFGRVDRRAVPVSSRGTIGCSVRVRRVGGGVGVSVGDINVDGSAALERMSFAISPGVQGEWASRQERSYEVGIEEAGDSQAVRVRTGRQVVGAGLVVTGMASLLPGQMCRLDWAVEASTFSGQGTDRNTVNTPVQLDIPRGAWCVVMVLDGAAADAAVRRQSSLVGGITGSTIVVEVRVD